MPNTPALVSCSATCFVKGTKLKSRKSEDPKLTFMVHIFSAIGICHEIPRESLMDAVTGLSGSGPAFVYMLIESLADGGVKKGLPRDLALKLAAQTVMGAGKISAYYMH